MRRMLVLRSSLELINFDTGRGKAKSQKPELPGNKELTEREVGLRRDCRDIA